MSEENRRRLNRDRGCVRSPVNLSIRLRICANTTALHLTSAPSTVPMKPMSPSGLVGFAGLLSNLILARCDPDGPKS